MISAATKKVQDMTLDKVNSAAKDAAAYYSDMSQKIQATTPDADEAINYVKEFAYSYVAWIPGGRKYIDTAFKDLDTLRQNHKDDVDKIIRRFITGGNGPEKTKKKAAKEVAQVINTDLAETIVADQEDELAAPARAHPIGIHVVRRGVDRRLRGRPAPEHQVARQPPVTSTRHIPTRVMALSHVLPAL